MGCLLTCLTRALTAPPSSYYFLVSLSILPPSAYPPLWTHAAALLHGRRTGLPPVQLGLVAGRLTAVQLAGAAIFLAGNILQWHSHWLLARLAGKGRRGGYKIPRGEGMKWGRPLRVDCAVMGHGRVHAAL